MPSILFFNLPISISDDVCRFTHVDTNGSNIVLLTAIKHTVGVCNFLSYFLTDGHLQCYSFLAVVNGAARNLPTCVGAILRTHTGVPHNSVRAAAGW